MSSQARGVRFPNSLWGQITEEAERQSMAPADFIRAACKEKLEGGGLESRLAARLEALASALPAATANEIDARIAARKAKAQQQQGGAA